MEAAVCDLPLKIVYNSQWTEEQSTFVKAGLRVLPDDCQAVMFLLSDQHHISSQLIGELIKRYVVNYAPITAPKVGKR